MKKTIILSIFSFSFAFTNAVKADMSLSGYAEFFAGSADQSKYLGVDNKTMVLTSWSFQMVTIQELLLTYSSTLDSGIDVSGTMNCNYKRLSR